MRDGGGDGKRRKPECVPEMRGALIRDRRGTRSSGSPRRRWWKSGDRRSAGNHGRRGIKG